MRRVAALLIVVSIVNGLLVAAQRTVAFPVRVASGSMQPRLHEGDRVLVRRISGTPREVAGTLRRGDVVVFRAPVPGEPFVVKRIVALPGELVQARDGVIAIDDERVLVEQWIPEGERSGPAAATVDIDRVLLGTREVYVLGDNRAHSVDSRSFGPVSIDRIVGRATVRVWPPSRIGRVRWRS